MKRDSRANRIAFRRAVWASVALHALIVGAIVLLLRATEKRSDVDRGIDTHADEPQVRISLSEEASVRIDEPPPIPPAPVKPQAAVAETPQVAIPETPALGPPLAVSRAVPRLLPSEMIVLIRKPTTTPAGDPNIRPAGGVPGIPAGVPAMHGALSPGKCVVYILDASGSMGADGKFDVARAALVSTLRQQPATVKFQVIVYAASATPLLTTDGKGLLASEANVRTAAEKLAALEPRGDSNHLAAVRAALAFRPDVILMLTDADDLSAAVMKPLLASAPKPVPLCVGHVTAEDVQRPRELK